MPTLAIIILLAGVCNLSLGVLILVKNPKEKTAWIFGIFCLIFSAWVFSNFLLIVTPSAFWLKSTYALGATSLAASTFWALEITGRKITLLKTILFIALGAIFTIGCYLGIAVRETSPLAFEQAYASGFEYESNSIFFLAYYIFLAGMLLYLTFTLISGYLKTKDVSKKRQVGLVSIGMSLSVISIMIGNFLFPALGLFQYSGILDSPSSLFFVAGSALAILRYNLFEIRVILTEILVIAMGIALLTLPFSVQGQQLKIITSIIFAAFCFFGYLLIRSSIRESKYKESLKQEVRTRTQELEKAKSMAESRADELEKAKGMAEQKTREAQARTQELERFYNLTVGRELKMIELKKKLKKIEEQTPKPAAA
jgi:hypothetical protein